MITDLTAKVARDYPDYSTQYWSILAFDVDFRVLRPKNGDIIRILRVAPLDQLRIQWEILIKEGSSVLFDCGVTTATNVFAFNFDLNDADNLQDDRRFTQLVKQNEDIIITMKGNATNAYLRGRVIKTDWRIRTRTSIPDTSGEAL